MATVNICGDFGAQENKVCHCFHSFPIYLPWSDETGCHDLSWISSQLFHSPLSLLSRGSLALLCFLPYKDIIFISEVIAISPDNLDSGLCFIQPSISHDVPCIEVKSAGRQYTALTYSFPNLEPIGCSMSSSNFCFLTCIQVSQETDKVVWYSHLLKNFPQFVVIHRVIGFGMAIVKCNEAEVDVLLEFSCFFYDPVVVGNLMSGSSAFSKPNLNLWKFSVHVLLKPHLKNFEHTLPACVMSVIVR